MALTRSLLFAGYWREGLNCAEEAMDRLVEDQTLGIDMLGENPYTSLAELRAVFLLYMGRVSESVQCFQKAIQRAREDHDLIMLCIGCDELWRMRWSHRTGQRQGRRLLRLPRCSKRPL
ncbi:MAG TPA: hypothetical protein VLF14_10080 [Candidatus Binatia bacterium]|nr:hypothetical protein [Candidatus Binatia bacterium]